MYKRQESEEDETTLADRQKQVRRQSQRERDATPITYGEIEDAFLKCYGLRFGSAALPVAQMCAEVEKAAGRKLISAKKRVSRAGEDGSGIKARVRTLNGWIREHFAEEIEDGLLEERRTSQTYWVGFLPTAAARAGRGAQ